MSNNSQINNTLAACVFCSQLTGEDTMTGALSVDQNDNARSQEEIDEERSSKTMATTTGTTTGTQMVQATKKDNGIKQRWKTALFCLEHGGNPIDVWYDCQECCDESCAWADSNGFNQCVSPYISREGTDNGKWVNLNSSRWQYMEYIDCGCMNK